MDRRAVHGGAQNVTSTARWGRFAVAAAVVVLTIGLGAAPSEATAGRGQVQRSDHRISPRGITERAERASHRPHRAEVVARNRGQGATGPGRRLGTSSAYHDGAWWITDAFIQGTTPSPAANPAPASATTAASPRESAPTATVQLSAARGSTDAVAVTPTEQLSLVPAAAPPASSLPDEALPAGAIGLAILAVALLLAVSVTALHKATRRAARLTSTQLVAASAGEDATRGARDLEHRLSLIHAWVCTLDERWQVLSESDKRLAMQIIRRNTDAAVGKPTELTVDEDAVLLGAP